VLIKVTQVSLPVRVLICHYLCLEVTQKLTKIRDGVVSNPAPYEISLFQISDRIKNLSVFLGFTQFLQVNSMMI
jgi:hypothetical protein